MQSSEIDFYMSRMFGLYRESILNLHKKQFKEEDVRGKSKQHYFIQQYYLAFLYVYLIFLEVKEGVYTDWSYYENKYEISKYRKAFACHNIDLDDLLAIYDLPLKTNASCVSGINSMAIEKCFIVEPSTLAVPIIETADIASLLANSHECTNYILTDCQ